MENRDDVIQRFRKLDMDLLKLDEFITLYIVGGSAIMLNRVQNRNTQDIDAFYETNERVEQLLNQYDINCQVRIGYKKNCHIKYSKRLEVPFFNIVIYVAINEYLFVMKMMAIISATRTDARKLIDKSDAYAMLPTLNFELAYEIAHLLIKEEFGKIESEYLLKEMKEWEEYWQSKNIQSTT